jgi:hypothetical protein
MVNLPGEIVEVTSEAELRELIAEPAPRAANKARTRLQWPRETGA